MNDYLLASPSSLDGIRLCSSIQNDQLGNFEHVDSLAQSRVCGEIPSKCEVGERIWTGPLFQHQSAYETQMTQAGVVGAHGIKHSSWVRENSKSEEGTNYVYCDDIAAYLIKGAQGTYYKWLKKKDPGGFQFEVGRHARIARSSVIEHANAAGLLKLHESLSADGTNGTEGGTGSA